MPPSDADLGRVRSTRAYRVAVWVARLCFVLGLCWAWLLIAVRPSPLAIVLTRLAFAAPVLCLLVLLRRAGAPIDRRSVSSWLVGDERMVRQLYLDMIWFRRP
jgi:hypothetical protein